jgi:hypothetical protein
VTLAQRAHWWCWWLSNYQCWDCISRQCSICWCRSYIRPRRSFHCRSKLPCDYRPAGALVVLVAVQLSVLGLYLPPVFKRAVKSAPDDHLTAGPNCRVLNRAAGALVVLVAVQLSVLGLYRPPVFTLMLPLNPPQTIISLPVQTAVCFSASRARWWCWWLSNYRCWDCIARQCSKTPLGLNPPQTIISLPVQTAVWRYRPAGALVVLVAVQLLVLGLYRPPVFKKGAAIISPRRSFHCRSRLPCDQVGQRAR